MDDDTGSNQYQRIIVALDGSEIAERVLPQVRPLAERFHSTVTLIEVVSLLGTPVPDRWQHDLIPLVDVLRQDALGYLSSVADTLRGDGLTVEFEVPMGEPAITIIDRASELGADLIAMTTIGRTGLSRVIFGSVADKVLKMARTPILLVRVEEGS